MTQRIRPVLTTILASALFAACSPTPQQPARTQARLDVVELSATEAARRMRDGALTAHDLTRPTSIASPPWTMRGRP